MYKVKMDDATVGGVNYFQNNAHRAWLPNPATRTTGAAGYRFSVAGRGETTGIVHEAQALGVDIIDCRLVLKTEQVSKE